MRISQNVWEPPSSRRCEHQRKGFYDCTCSLACLPDGYNIPIYNDKKTKNRFLHIPADLFQLMLMHGDLR